MAFGSGWSVLFWSAIVLVAIFTLPVQYVWSFSVVFLIAVFFSINVIEWWDRREESKSRK